MARKALPGAVLTFYVNNNTKVGWATDLTLNDNHNLVRIDVLGNIYTEEIETVGINVSFSAGMVRIKDEVMASFGLRPTGDTGEIAAFDYFSGQVADQEGNVLWAIEKIRFESASWNITRDAVVTANANFQATRLIEAAPKQ